MFKSKAEIEEIKMYPIADYLHSIGIEPADNVGNQLLYYSPLTNENTASFYVEPHKNVFNDFSSGQRGDLLRLVQLIEQIPFKDAVKRIEGLKSGFSDSSFSFSGISIEPCPKIEIVKVQTIQNNGLIQYIEQRGINIDLARMYCKEVHFKNKDKQYFAVGFANGGGGYELRNGLGFKGKTANGITVFDKATNQINLFEGFFDFLSALQYYNTYTFNNTTIILNTNNNLKLFLETVTDSSIINSFLDNDRSGESVVNQLVSKGFVVLNQSRKVYPNSKDFNDYLLGKSMETA